MLEAISRIAGVLRDDVVGHRKTYLLSFVFSAAVAISLHVAHLPVYLFVPLFLLMELLLRLLEFWLENSESISSVLKRHSAQSEIQERFLADYSRNPNVFEAISGLDRTALALSIAALEPRIEGGATDWAFRDYFAEKRAEFARSVRDYSAGTIWLTAEDVAKISLKLPTETSHCVFCTAMRSGLDSLFSGESDGMKLFSALEGLAKRLEVQSTEKGNPSGAVTADSEIVRSRFVRLYIFDSIDHVEWRHYVLMRQNAANSVVVLFCLRRDAEAALERVRSRRSRVDMESCSPLRTLDFGLWDDCLVFDVGVNPHDRVIVSRNRSYVEEATELRSELLGSGKVWSWVDFSKKFMELPNDWTQFYAQNEVLNLPPSNGPGDADLDAVIREISGVDYVSGDNIVVYGATARLIQCIVEALGPAGRLKNWLGAEVICVDARPIFGAPASDFGPKVRFVSGNWLCCEPLVRGALSDQSRGQIACIVGDDVLANVAKHQYPLFFETARNVLRRGGRIVLRTSAIFTDIPPHRNLDQLLLFFRDAELQCADFTHSLGALGESAIYEAVWPALLWSDNRDPHTGSFDFLAWNARLRNLRVSEELRDKLRQRPVARLPAGPVSLRMTSLDWSEVKRLAELVGLACKDPMPVSSVWKVIEPLGVPSQDRNHFQNDFQKCYALTVFQKADT